MLNIEDPWIFEEWQLPAANGKWNRTAGENHSSAPSNFCVDQIKGDLQYIPNEDLEAIKSR